MLVPPGYEARMPRFDEALDLVDVGKNHRGRDVRLAPEAASAWTRMREEAVEEGIALLLVSGFRSIAYQASLVERKMEKGIPAEEILRFTALPGFSEHHSGRAVDIGSPDADDLTEAFGQTKEFEWLSRNASRFGFSLSYPRDNRCGIAYEPWHWMFRSPPAS